MQKPLAEHQPESHEIKEFVFFHSSAILEKSSIGRVKNIVSLVNTTEFTVSSLIEVEPSLNSDMSTSHLVLVNN